MKLSADTIKALCTYRDRLASTTHGERERVMVEAEQTLGKSRKTIYRWLISHAGWDSGRAVRRDAGTTAVAESTLLMLGALKKESTRKNKKIVMSTATACNIAHLNGAEVPVTVPTINRLLKARRLDNAAQSQSKNTQKMRALHPNHVHEIDPSLCLIYYMRGKQVMMRAEEFYKNKLEKIAQIKLKVWRYVRYDRASGAMDCHYYEAAGESQANLFDFLMHTWAQDESRLSYGVPRMLYWDKGSANQATAIKNLLKSLDVEDITHAAERPWAKGGVEVCNNIIETAFESRLKIQPVHSIDELNAAKDRWLADFNANRLVHIDARIHRAGGNFVRDDLWSLILRTPEALRECPPREVCGWFMQGKEVTRQVTNLGLSFVHPEIGVSRRYDLSDYAEHLHNGEVVTVQPILLKDGAISVEIARLGEKPLIVTVQPTTGFDAFGDPLSATPFGQYRSARDSAGETVGKAMAKLAYGADTLGTAEEARRKQARPFAHVNDGQGMVAHSTLGQTPAVKRLIPKPTSVETMQVVAVRERMNAPAPEIVVPITQAIFRIAKTWGSVAPEDNQSLRAQYPHGIEESLLEQIIKIGNIHGEIYALQKIA